MEDHCHHTADAAWFHIRRASGLRRGLAGSFAGPFFTRSRSSTAGADGGAVNPPLLPIEGTALVKALTQGNQQTSEAPLLTPAAIAIVNRLQGP